MKTNSTGNTPSFFEGRFKKADYYYKNSPASHFEKVGGAL
jgi:hypothetical protein